MRTREYINIYDGRRLWRYALAPLTLSPFLLSIFFFRSCDLCSFLSCILSIAFFIFVAHDQGEQVNVSDENRDALIKRNKRRVYPAIAISAILLVGIFVMIALSIANFDHLQRQDYYKYKGYEIAGGIFKNFFILAPSIIIYVIAWVGNIAELISYTELKKEDIKDPLESFNKVKLVRIQKAREMLGESLDYVDGWACFTKDRKRCVIDFKLYDSRQIKDVLYIPRRDDFRKSQLVIKVWTGIHEQETIVLEDLPNSELYEELKQIAEKNAQCPEETEAFLKTIVPPKPVEKPAREPFVCRYQGYCKYRDSGGNRGASDYEEPEDSFLESSCSSSSSSSSDYSARTPRTSGSYGHHSSPRQSAQQHRDNVAPWERYAREDDALQGWYCNHDDSYGCDE